MFVKVTGVCAVTRTAETKTSSKAVTFVVSITFCSCAISETEENNVMVKIVFALKKPDRSGLFLQRGDCLNKGFIRKILRNKRGNYSVVKIKIDDLRQIYSVHSKNVVVFSLGSITRPGSLGIISARYLEHPFETGQN